MTAVAGLRWWSIAGLIVLSATTLTQGAMAQGSTLPPLKATLFFRNPPPDLTFSPTAPITIVLQVQNISPAAVNTTEGFSATEFWRRLFFTLPGGAIVTDTTEAAIHTEIQPGFCFSRRGVLQRPTAIPVVPVEVLAGSPTPFFLEYVIDDARRFYDLSRTGSYTVNARIPLLTFSTADPNAVITDCDQFAGTTVVNVAAVTGRQAFTIVSNSLQFTITRYRLVGFLPPIVNDGDPTCTAFPCRTYKFGSTVPVKFQLFNELNQVVSTAVARIAVALVSGTEPPQTPEDLGAGVKDTGNQFRFDPVSQQYIFNLDTGVLGRGVWRVDAILDDGRVRSVHIGLR